MFTGIIGALGTVESITPIEGSDAAYLTLNAGDIVADLEHGGSLAVNGVCLTAIDLDQLQPGQFRAYAMGETLRRTNLGNLNPGDTVNLERCLPAGTASTVTSCRVRGCGGHPRIRHRPRGVEHPAFQPAHRTGTPAR